MMRKTSGKKAILAGLILSLSLLIVSCQVSEKAGTGTGSLIVKFDLSGSISAKSILDDFSQVSSGKVFLEQDGVVKYEADLVVDNVNKTGEGSISDLVIGTYDVIVELYDSASEVLYSETDTMTITSDTSHSLVVQLGKNNARLSVSGSWTEDISDLSSAIVQLKRKGRVKYESDLRLNTDNKTVRGSINHIRPGFYEVYVEIKDTSGMVCFTGSRIILIRRGRNRVALTLVVKTGSVIINISGDVSAPVIISGPAVSINGQDATITWTTDENATSNVCYSTTQGFDYQTETNWAPVGQDLSADNTDHSVTIEGLVQDQTYYYVVVSIDDEGNMIVSDEERFVVTGKIAFSSDRNGNWEICVMNADGSGPVRLTNNSANVDMIRSVERRLELACSHTKNFGVGIC
jgi:hypothetical protein